MTNGWVKQAILLYFGRRTTEPMGDGNPFTYFDKIRMKSNFKELGVRCVPGGVARYGSFLGRGAILMPGFVNIGAYVDEGSMVDTWATVGSCAQIGKNVHLAGGVGIGGVLEPPQAAPVIVEDGAFIGSRCIVVEGVRVGREAVLGAGVVSRRARRSSTCAAARPRSRAVSCRRAASSSPVRYRSNSQRASSARRAR